MEQPRRLADVVSSFRTDYGATSSANDDQNNDLDNYHDSAALVDEEKLKEALNKRFASSALGRCQRFSAISSKSSSLSVRSKESFTCISRSSCSRSRSMKMGVDTMPNSETRQIVQRVEYFLSVVNHVCIGFITIYMSWLCLRTGLAGTALHAWLVTIGFCLLMTEGAMSHYTGNVLTFNYKRTTKTTIHWVLQALGGACGVAGVIAKIVQKGFKIQSTHSQLGFAAFVLCLASMLSGLSALFSSRVKRVLNPLFNKSLHNLVGVASLVVGMLAQYYGYETGFFSRKVSEDFQLLMKVLTLVALVLTSIGPLKAMYHKTCNIIRHFD